jgi:hypothetical protein
MEVADVGNGHVFAFVRQSEGVHLLAVHNMTEQPQPIAANELRLIGRGYTWRDLIGGEMVRLDERPAEAPGLTLSPYQALWLVGT